MSGYEKVRELGVGSHGNVFLVRRFAAASAAASFAPTSVIGSSKASSSSSSDITISDNEFLVLKEPKKGCAQSSRNACCVLHTLMQCPVVIILFACIILWKKGGSRYLPRAPRRSH